MNFVYFFCFLAIIFSLNATEHAAELISKKAFEEGEGGLDYTEGNAENLSENSAGQDVTRVGRIIIPYESVTETPHFDASVDGSNSPPTSLSFPLVSHPELGPLSSIFHIGSYETNTAGRLHIPGNVYAQRNTDFKMLKSPAFAGATIPHFASRNHMNLDSASLPHLHEHLGPTHLNAVAQLLPQTGDSSKNQPFQVETEGGLNFQSILKSLNRKESSPANRWFYSPNNHEKLSPGSAHYPKALLQLTGLNVHQHQIPSSVAGNSTSPYSQWLKGNKSISEIPHVQGVHRQYPTSKLSTASLTATSPSFAIPSSSGGITKSVSENIHVSPIHRYFNEIYNINNTRPGLASSSEIDLRDKRFFSSKFAPDHSSHSEPLPMPFASNNGYIGTLGMLGRYNTLTDPTTQLGDSSRYGILPKRLNTLDFLTVDATQANVNRLGQGNPNRQGIPGECNKCKLRLKYNHNSKEGSRMY